MTIYLLMSLTAFSQVDSTSYPKTVILNNDTVTQFYSWQAKKLATQLVEGDMYKSLYETTEVQLFTCNLVLNNKDSIIALKEKKINSFANVILYKDSISNSQKNIITSQTVIIKQINKKAKFRKIRNWLSAIGGIVVTGFVVNRINK